MPCGSENTWIAAVGTSLRKAALGWRSALARSYRRDRAPGQRPDGVTQLPGKKWIVDGLRYRAVPTLTRSVYDRSFGDTPAPPLEFTVGQGPASITAP
jgi:hypothetical protein